jgi:hypothetical protein
VLRTLDKHEKEEAQRKGYMCEHLLCLYSMLSDKTALYNNTFPVFLNRYGEVDIILFGLENDEDEEALNLELNELQFKTLNIISPVAIKELPHITTRSTDWDFHIDVGHFNFSLRGHRHKNIRYSLRQIDKLGYHLRIGKEFTPNHTYILSRHMARHTFNLWDYEEMLSLERFYREHSHGLIMEAYVDNRLIGFDIIDFFEDKKIMVVPLGIYLDAPRISDFMMYENLKYAKDNGYEWLDVGTTCGNRGIQSFKEKWFAEPKYKLYVQTVIRAEQDHDTTQSQTGLRDLLNGLSQKRKKLHPLGRKRTALKKKG